MTDLERALAVALTAHRGQTRHDGVTPYILHPLRVMLLVARDSTEGPAMTTTMMTAAVLHDVVENCPGITVSHLLDQFGPAVAELVDLLTRRRTETYLDFIRRVNTNPFARQIKRADIHDNLDSGEADATHGERMRQRYTRALAILE